MKEVKYVLPQKSSLKQIKVSDIEIDLPDLKNISESKAIAIAKWMINWIDSDVNVKPNFLCRQNPI